MAARIVRRVFCDEVEEYIAQGWQAIYVRHLPAYGFKRASFLVWKEEK